LTFWDKKNGLYITSNGSIYRTSNGGDSWALTSEVLLNNEQLRDIVIDKKGKLVMCSDVNIFVSQDSGNTWSAKRTQSIFQPVYTVSFDKQNTGFAAGDSCVIIKSTDRGRSWNLSSSFIDSSYLLDFGVYDSLYAIAVGSSGVIMLTIDGGVTWQRKTSNTSHTLTGVAIVNKSLSFACGYAGTILKTTNGGESWSSIVLDSIFHFNYIAFDNNKTGYVVYHGKAVFRTTDLGESWTKLPDIPISTYLYGVSCLDSNRVIAVGTAGTIIKSTNGGQSWISTTYPDKPNLNKVQYIDSMNIAITGEHNIILSTDGGGTWQGGTDFYMNMTSSHYFSKDTGVAVGPYRILYCPSHYDTTWYPALDTSWNPPVDTTITGSVAKSTVNTTIYATPNPSNGEFSIDGDYRNIDLFDLLGKKLDYSIHIAESKTYIKVNQDYSGVAYCQIRTWDNQIKVFSLILY